MARAYTIHEDSREGCAQALTELCTAFGLDATLPPRRQPGTERWIARATVTAQHEAPPTDADGASAR